MKIGILTFPNSVSYGATLQMYALYRAIRAEGHEAEVINYHNAYMKGEHHLDKNKHASVKRFLKTRVRMLLHGRLYRAFRRFEAETVTFYPSRPFSNKQTLPSVGQRYDTIVCGSDQVWNPHITDTDMSYFLDFCGEKTRRVSYAPSFGVEEFSKEFTDAVQAQLTQFAAVSVREKTGADFVRPLVEKDVAVVADPTFLLDTSEWQAIEKEHPAAAGEYMLYFAVHRSDALLRRCRAISRARGLKLIVVGGNPLKRLKNRDPMIEYAVDVSPAEWLYLIHHARLVVTDSFHGTVFSVIFHRDFFVEYPRHANSRLVHLLTELGLSDRVLRADAEPTVEPIAYDYTDRRRAEMKAMSQEFLKTSLEV